MELQELNKANKQALLEDIEGIHLSLMQLHKDQRLKVQSLENLTDFQSSVLEMQKELIYKYVPESEQKLLEQLTSEARNHYLQDKAEIDEHSKVSFIADAASEGITGELKA